MIHEPDWHDELGFIPHLPGMPEAINADSFDDDVLAAPGPVVVEFWAARCGPCRRLAPELAAAGAQMGGWVRVFTVNVDEELPAAERFGVHAIPALLYFEGGQERARQVGVVGRDALVHWLGTLVSQDAPNTETETIYAENNLG